MRPCTLVPKWRTCDHVWWFLDTLTSGSGLASSWKWVFAGWITCSDSSAYALTAPAALANPWGRPAAGPIYSRYCAVDCSQGPRSLSSSSFTLQSQSCCWLPALLGLRFLAPTFSPPIRCPLVEIRTSCDWFCPPLSAPAECPHYTCQLFLKTKHQYSLVRARSAHNEISVTAAMRSSNTSQPIPSTFPSSSYSSWQTHIPEHPPRTPPTCLSCENARIE